MAAILPVTELLIGTIKSSTVAIGLHLESIGNSLRNATNNLVRVRNVEYLSNVYIKKMGNCAMKH